MAAINTWQLLSREKESRAKKLQPNGTMIEARTLLPGRQLPPFRCRHGRLRSALSPEEEQEPRVVSVQEGVRPLHRQEGAFVFVCRHS